MFITGKIIIYFFFPFYISSLSAGDNQIVSAYLAHDSQTILFNAKQCYKDGFYDISFDLCQAYLENEKQSKNKIDNAGVSARLLLGFNLLKKEIKSDDYRFNLAQDSLLEICCEPEKTKALDKDSLVHIQEYTWRILAKLYMTQQDCRKSGKCLYNSLAVQYNAYNDIYTHVFPRHRPGQLRCITYLMNNDKEYKSFIMDSISELTADDQAWFLSALFERAWQQEDSLDALWLLAQHKKVLEKPVSDYENILYTFRLHVESAQAMEQGQKVDLNEVYVELLNDHPELADSYSIMWCKNHNVSHYSVYEQIKKSYLDYVDRDAFDPDKMVFLAILWGRVVGKGLLRKPSQQGPVQYVSLNLCIDEAYKQKRIGAKLAETMLLYAQTSWQAERAYISSNKSQVSSIRDGDITNLLRILQRIKRDSQKES